MSFSRLSSTTNPRPRRHYSRGSIPLQPNMGRWYASEPGACCPLLGARSAIRLLKPVWMNGPNRVEKAVEDHSIAIRARRPKPQERQTVLKRYGRGENVRSRE